jgi:hypothetical protein
MKLWAERPGTLSDHYQSIREIPTETKNVSAIEAILTEHGIRIDTENDLLMECLRYSVQFTDFQEMYGPNPKRSPATPSLETLNTLISTSDQVFRHRFETTFGLNPETITSLMDQLKQIRIYDLSPADLEIPAHFK